MTKSEIGKKLRYLRHKNMLSVDDLSNMFKEINYPISTKAIYNWESGKVIPDVEILNKLSYFFNTTMAVFFENDRRCQALTDSELEFITKIRIDRNYRKIITLLTKKKKEELINENSLIYKT